MMGAFFIRIECILAITTVCSAYITTPDTTAIGNDTTTQSQTSGERMVDAYQKLMVAMSKQLSAGYPVPPKFYSSFYNIYASFEPLQIITLDEVLQSISMSSAITLSWKDPSVKWNPQEFEGIEWVKLPSSFFWLPDIIIPETAVEDGKLTIPNVLDVSYQGLITVLIPTITTTLCNLDLTYFPFDEQNCTLAMMESDFYNMTSRIVLLGDMNKYFGTNAAWKLVNHECHPQISVESDPSFSYVNCHVEISRRSAFYVINLIGPMGMTSLMTLIAFCVPAEGGEKISFIVSMFMSTSVFYNYIINITPRSMEHLPRVNILLVAIAVQITFATAAIIFVLIRYSKTKKHQQYQELCNFQEEDNQNNRRCQPDNITADNGGKATPPTNETISQNKSIDESCFDNGVKKRPGKSTAVRSDDTNENAFSRKKTVDSNGRCTCDELDILFLCVMCVLTALLYICIFLV